jgi:hypothetical protein
MEYEAQSKETLPSKSVAASQPPHTPRSPPTTQSQPVSQPLPSIETNTVSPSTVLLLALHFVEPEHWCGVFVDFTSFEITFYDPFQDETRYARMEDWASEHLLEHLPRPEPPVYKYKLFRLAKHSDNYNCGVLVLLFFEMCLNGSRDNCANKDDLPNLLNFARLRYLTLGLSAPELQDKILHLLERLTASDMM